MMTEALNVLAQKSLEAIHPMEEDYLRDARWSF